MKNHSNKKLNLLSSPSKNREKISYDLNKNLNNKNSILSIDYDLNKNKLPKKRFSQISIYEISDNELNKESNYISSYIRNNLKIPPKKNSLKLELKLENILNNKKYKNTTTIIKKGDLKLSPNFTKNFKKQGFHSYIIGKKNSNNLNKSNSLSSLIPLNNNLEKNAKIENKHILNLYKSLISNNFCVDLNKDIINLNGGYRNLFRQRKLSDSELSDDIVIKIDSSEKYIIHPSNNYFVIFKVIIFILIFYLIIFYPLSFAFHFFIPLQIHIIIDFIFIIDFFLGFFIGIFDDEGKMVKQLQQCSYSYITKGFFKNLIISFPFLSIFHNSNSFFKILPLIRIFKFYEFTFNEKDSELYYDKLIINLHIIQPLSVHNPLYSFLEFFVGFFILLHISTCVFVFLLDSSDYPNWTTTNFDDSNSRNYISGFYFSLTTIITVGYGDVTPVSYNERLYTIILMIIGVCLYSMVLSILSSLFEDFQNKEKNNKKNIYILDELRNKYHIPDEIYHKVLRYLKYTSVINSKDNNLLMNSLPKYYKCALLYEIHGESLNNINIFKGQSNEFKFQSVLFLKELNLIKGEFLIQSGDIVEEFYMVKKGILQIQKETNYIKIKILKIREKEHFGEIYMTSGIPMPFDITGYSKFCELFYFKKSDFITLYEDFPKEIEKILNLSWKNTIRIEMRAKMLFEKAENENYHNLSLTASNNEKKNIKNKDKYYNNKLTVIHEECISSNFNNTLQNEEEENSFKRTHNHLTNKNMIKVKSKERNNLNLDNSNGNIKNNNLNQVKNNTSLNNNKLKTKNKDKILKSTIQLKSKLSDHLKIKNIRRASTPLNIKSFNIKTKNPVKKYNKFFNSMKKTSIFHLPLINFSNGNGNLSDSEIKNKKKFNKQKSISQTIKPKLSKKQINNYNVNLNLNIENNYNSNNLEKSNSVHKKKDTMNLILKNLKGLSENLKNPTSFFRNYENNHVSAFMSSKNEINLKNNSIISKVNKNLIDNMNIHIDKIDKIYEKIITSLLEKYMKNQKK